MTSIPAHALQSRLVAAEAAARAAGQVLLGHYNARDKLAVEQKGINDFVSNADREAEDVIMERLVRLFPEDGLLGEETGRSGPANAPAVWCVDPLDGTSNFLKGAHNWCVSIGLASTEGAVLGVIYDPLRDEMFTAAAGQGTRCNGTPIHVSPTGAMNSANIGLGHNRRVPVDAFVTDAAKVLATGAGYRQLGAGALMLAYVAAGRVEAYYERHMLAWDAMAGLALIKEAGGMAYDYPTATGPLERGGIVLASNAALYPVLTEMLF